MLAPIAKRPRHNGPKDFKRQGMKRKRLKTPECCPKAKAREVVPGDHLERVGSPVPATTTSAIALEAKERTKAAYPFRRRGRRGVRCHGRDRLQRTAGLGCRARKEKQRLKAKEATWIGWRCRLPRL